MTREEAIEILENGGWWDLLIPITTIEGRVEEDKLHEAIDLALAALRPVSREQVEKVWKGEWVGVPSMGVYDTVCSKCGYCPGIRFWSSDFCPHCGAPMTDEAVDILLRRLEALHDNRT